MEIKIKIPKSVIELCKEYGIPVSSIPTVFKNYINQKLGVDDGWGLMEEEFQYWCEDSDNISDYQKKSSQEA